MATAQAAQQNRLQIFANVFKGYMGVMPLVTAALAPLLTTMNVIPTYEPQRKPLATMTGILGFLLLAWLFYVRRTIALGSMRRGFRWLINLSPLLLIVASVGCYVTYAHELDLSVAEILSTNPTVTRTQALGDWTLEHPAPRAVQLQLLYLGMFLAAEAAFVMMAMREYANDVQAISEYAWMFGDQPGSPGLTRQPPSTMQIATPAMKEAMPPPALPNGPELGEPV